MRQTTTSARTHALLFFMLVSLLLLQPTLAATGFTNQQSLYFTGSSSSVGQYYQDAISPNIDVGIELCGQGPSQYVGGLYALFVTGSGWQYVPVTYSSSTLAFGQTGSTDVGGGCYRTTDGAIFVSPSKLTTPDPDIMRAAFPGQLWIGYDSSSPNPGTISNFVFGGSNAELKGSYTITRTFDQSTNDITISTPTITFTTQSGSFSKSASDTTFGIDDTAGRHMVIGVCDDNQGTACSDGQVVTDSSSFPLALSTGLSGVTDQTGPITKYVVDNGLGYDICIGTNLQVAVSSISPDPVYYSQNLTIQFTVSNPRDTPTESNGGNVDVTTDFDVELRIYPVGQPSNEVYATNITVTDLLVPDGSTTKTVIWPAIAHSGNYIVSVEADIGDAINECNEGDNVDNNDQFELKPITIPTILIDGDATRTFNYSNVPYNVKMHFENSDGDILSNATVVITEENGLSLTAPTQIYNRSDNGDAKQDGLRVSTVVTFLTDDAGNASFTFTPTYNKLYLPQYGYTDLDNYIGNYSLYYTGTQSDAEPFRFVVKGSVYTNQSFTIANTSYTGPYVDKTLTQETMVSQVMDFIYQTFAAFLDTVRG
ncbi:hypothetical protein D6789_00190 [Candidatus Woesearchaeota archaeon]|nr:MAG: hypothetical protein D6789_00190 [Candidatus Woesearchaeota archaeon]